MGIIITVIFIKTCSFSSHTSFLVSHSAVFVSSRNASPLLKWDYNSRLCSVLIQKIIYNNNALI